MPRRHASAGRADAALARFGLRARRRRFVREGENVTYRVDHAGRAYALRIHRPGYQTAASVRSEMAWMEALRAEGVATPDVVRSVSGDVVEEVRDPRGRASGGAVRMGRGRVVRAPRRPALWERLGGLMARLHVRGRALRGPAGFVRQAWDDEGMVGATARCGATRSRSGAWDADAGARARGGANDGARAAAALPRTPDRYGLVHGDLAFDNVLVRADGTPVIIDFDDCGWSWYPWELAVALFPFDGEPGFDERRDALVRGYRAVAPLPDDVLAELPTFVMARRLVTLGWLFLHPHTAHAVSQREWRLRTLGPAIERYLASAGT